MTTVRKKGSAKVVEPADSVPVEVEAIAPAEGIKVDHDEKAGTAKFSLVSGEIVTLREPKAKEFIYLASRMETAPAWQRSGTMAVYLLAHFMITEISGRKTLPDFDEFMDMLQDDDLARVGAAFSCFPNVLSRVARVYGTSGSPGA
jgi:hypothetical protein